MYAFLAVVYFLVCFFMVVIVLLQQGRGSGMGAAFGGGTQALFGARGRATPLQKVTTAMAILFMLLSIALASLSGGDDSALFQAPAKPGEEVGLQPEAPGAPAADAPAAPAGDAPAAPTADAPAAPAGDAPAAPAGDAPDAPAAPAAAPAKPAR